MTAYLLSGQSCRTRKIEGGFHENDSPSEQFVFEKAFNFYIFQYSISVKIKRFIALIVTFALLYNLPKFWELTVNLNLHKSLTNFPNLKYFQLSVKTVYPSHNAMVMAFLQLRESLNISNSDISLFANIARNKNVTKTVNLNQKNTLKIRFFKEIVPTEMRLNPVYVKVSFF